MKNKITYVLNTFLSYYQVDNYINEIEYGNAGNTKIIIPDLSDGFFQNKKKYDIENINFVYWLDQKIPLLFPVDKKTGKPFHFINDQIILNFDLISAVFFLLSGWQEYVNDNRDEHGRFPFRESIQSKLNIIHLPLVNYYFDILKTVIEHKFKIKIKHRLWDKFDYAYAISYDIDKSESGWLEGSFREAKKGHIFIPFYLIMRKLIGKDVWFNFKEVQAFQDRNKYKGTWFFMSRSKKTHNHTNADYKLDSKKYQKALKNLIKSNEDISLHGSYGASKDLNLLMDDIAKFPIKECGIRFHYLNYDTKKSPLIIEKSGLLYDSSLYFPEESGFRNSVCFPFQIYDLSNDCITNVIEIPLTMMDTSFRNKKYYSTNNNCCLEKTSQLLTEVKKFKGLFTILWHNTSFSQYKYSGWKQMLVKILSLFTQHNVKNYTFKEIVNQFKMRD